MPLRLPLFFTLLALACTAPLGADVTGDNNTGGAIPDNDAAGVVSTITITDQEIIQNARFEIEDLTHEWVGDLVATITHTSTTGAETDARLFFRTGKAQSSGSGDSSNLLGTYEFRDDGSSDWWAEAGSGSNLDDTLASGAYRASGNLGGFVDLDTIFGGQSTEGDWTLRISDLNDQHAGSFSGWNVEFITAVPEPASALAIFGAGALFLRRRRLA